MSIIEKAMERARQEREASQEKLAPSIHRETDTPPTEISRLEEVTHEQLPASKQNHTEKHIEALTKADAQQSTQELAHEESHDHEQITQINPIPELIMATNEALTLGGSYRLLKEYIIALRKSEPERSMFMVTSAMRNEGKTLTSCNLACALAMEFDTTVLLIDVDLRAPSCQRVLGIKNPPKGLSDCLLHNTPIHECLVHTGIGKLSLLCAGSIIENPAELITSNRMQSFLTEVKNRYPDRIIILDSLPLLPFAESRALSRMTDGVMLVVRENVTYKSHVDTALQHLQDVPLLGMVYNAATAYGTEKDIFNYSYYGYDAEEKKL